MANRALESNGPNVKVRGTPSHICKRYQMLARDAQSQGDRVRVENYLQHAEHYYRLTMQMHNNAQQNAERNSHAEMRDMDSPPPPPLESREPPPLGDEIHDMGEPVPPSSQD